MDLHDGRRRWRRRVRDGDGRTGRSSATRSSKPAVSVAASAVVTSSASRTSSSLDGSSSVAFGRWFVVGVVGAVGVGSRWTTRSFGRAGGVCECERRRRGPRGHARPALEALSSPPPPRRSPPRASSARARVVVVRRREIVRWRPRAAPRRRGVAPRRRASRRASRASKTRQGRSRAVLGKERARGGLESLDGVGHLAHGVALGGDGAFGGDEALATTARERSRDARPRGGRGPRGPRARARRACGRSQAGAGVYRGFKTPREAARGGRRRGDGAERRTPRARRSPPPGNRASRKSRGLGGDR